MRPPLNDANRHLNDDELARLADPGQPREPWIAEHLVQCPHCMALSTEMLGLRAEALLADAVDPLPEAWKRRALAVGAAGEARAAVMPVVHRGRATRRLVLAGMAAALVVAVGWSVVRFREESRRDRITVQLRADSHGGLLYAGNLPPNPRGVRGSTGGSDLDKDIAGLAGRHNRGDRSADNAFWLVGGYLSVNDLSNADAYLREAMAAHPADERLLNLSAILAWKRNDLGRAAEQLDAALRVRRQPYTLYNRAVVALAAGDSAAGQALFDELERQFPVSPEARLRPAREGEPVGER